MRLLRLLGLCALIAGAASLKLACSAGVHVNAGLKLGAAEAHLDVDAGGYAAMDEVPVAGGELRLVTPLVLEFDGAPREMIGMPLRHTQVTAKVSGGVGVYEIEQVFDNPFDRPIEAVYAFPLGAHGAITGYQLAIGERTIRGEIHTTTEAQTIYDDAIQRGHTAAIVKQDKPNLFTQRVGNIPVGQHVTIKLTFVELLDYKDGAYEMVVPTTIGPRYKAEAEVAYVPSDQATAMLGFTADLDPGMPVVQVTSLTHAIATRGLSPTRTEVTLARGDVIPNKDLVVRFATAGPETRVGVVADRHADTGYFVLTVQPKTTYRTGDIAGREVMIVIDHSGSMEGEPLAQAKGVASGILDTLTERDTFDIIGFASGVESLAPTPVRGDADGKARGVGFLQAMRADGGTEMGGGIAAMLAHPPGEDRVRVIYFLTDGDVGNDDAIVNGASSLLGGNRIFTIGVGSAPNRSLLDRLARTGRGYASYLAPRESPTELATTLVARSAYPYLTDLKLDWNGLDVDGVTPAVMPDVYAGQPIVISGRYHRAGTARVTIHARTAGRVIDLPIDVTLPEARAFPPAEALWARRQIEELEVPGVDDRHLQIQELGLRFHLVTAYTSFVAVDRDGKPVGSSNPLRVDVPAVTPEDYGGGTSSTSSSSHDRSSYSGFGGWGSGGPESSLPWGWLVLGLAVLPLWLVVRRCV